MKKIKIETEGITLNQFLKWASIVGSGAEAKELIQAGEVLVNGVVENRRGRKLKINDIIELRGSNEKYQVSR
ncbi:MAG TPA: RNA-binding S4 domain-containing protein [Halanaerobiaceae bacterium]|jgi:ribosome-associated protein|nr:RNA-binding S4 domain-containing protein [Bacillota bacterium]HHU91872.1 RNA-binding S4 domain-containing protein [Halanaerobiaceae bacterium]HOA40773.1 RNA-binding S4 domain-containing protein [Halanaerobiales bacterium]HPZ62979.1 RNA-binding S4 domain-containing protein [Halanaerobiales bacterium]HQD04212.1 RNA-binding S4 domain-containing protein [Halanaerobiales bacterium]